MDKDKDNPVVTKIFYPGYFNSKHYRIPSMITTVKGTIIAGIDARIEDSRDNPNKIETTVRRSLDNGQTWDFPQRIVSYPGEGTDGAAAIDTALLQDEETETIWMIFSHTPGGIGLAASVSGIGFDDQGRKLLFDTNKKQYFLSDNGKVYDADENLTEYTVDKDGNVYKGKKHSGNIYLKRGIDPNETLLEARTSFLQAVRSDDDGLTWSTPIDLNSQVKESWMKFIGSGPGRGLQLKHGKHKDRLIFPIYFTNENRCSSCAVIYSDDNGNTWNRSKSPNDGRLLDGDPLTAKSLSERQLGLSESQLVEMPNGELHAYMRNHSGKSRTAVAVSNDGGKTWGNIRYDDELLDPTCQSTILKYPDVGDGKTRLIFANPAHPDTRKSGMVRLSEDGGKTWPFSKLIEADSFIYSCLTILPDGKIGLLYETDADGGYDAITINFLKFTLDWIKS